MPALTSLLVRDSVLSIRKIEDALQRQVLEGGEIDTVLLEMEAVPENVLNAYRAASFGLLPASRHELMSIPRNTLRTVPLELAERHRVVPLSAQMKRMVLGVARPLSNEVVEELRKRLGSALVLKVATVVRVEAALAAHYALAIAPRLQLLAEKLDERDPGVLPDVYPMDQDKVSRFGDDFATRITSELAAVEDLAEGTEPVRLRARAKKGPADGAGMSSDPPIVRVTGPSTWRSRQERDGGADMSAEGGAGASDGDSKGDGSGQSDRPSSRSGPAGEVDEVERGKTLKGLRRTGPPEQEPEAEPEPERRRHSWVGVTRVLGVGVESVPPKKSEVRETRVSVVDELQPAGRQQAEQSPEQRAEQQQQAREALKAAFPSADVVSGTQEASAQRRGSDRPERRYVGRGALTPGVERELLANARNRDDVVEIWLEFARQYFDCAVIFAFREQSMVVLDCHGIEAIADIRAINLSIDADSTVYEVRRAGLGKVADLSRKPADKKLLGALGRTDCQPCFLLPVKLRTRPVLLFYGDRGGELFELEDVTDVIEIVPSVVRTFERVVRARKALLAHGSEESRGSEPPESSGQSGVVGGESSSSRPGGTTNGAAGWSAGEGATSAGATSEGAIGEGAIGEGARGIGTTGAGAAEAAASAAASRPTESETAPVPMKRAGAGRKRIVTGSFESPIEERRQKPTVDTTSSRVRPTVREIPAGYLQDEMTSTNPMFAANTGTLVSTDERMQTDGLAPVSSSIPQGAGAGEAPEGGADSGVSGGGSGEAQAQGGEQEARQEAVAALRDGGKDAGIRAALISELMRWPERAVQSQPPAAEVKKETAEGEAADEKPVPSVVVDMGSEHAQLVEELMTCRREQESEIVEALVKLGEAVLPELVQKFPGYVWFKRGQPYHRLPSGRDLSAIARAILAFGPVAVPYVRSLLFSSDPDVRFYALMMAGDLPCKSLLEPLEQRLFDADGCARRISVDVLARFKEVEGYSAVLAALRAVAAAPGRATDTRVIAIEALAGLRDANSCTVLIELLNAGDRLIVKAAHRALVTITLQDHRTSMRNWTNWMGRNRDRSRVEWLIDSLTHSDQSIRTAAGAELKRTTNQHYDFHPASSKRELKKVQKRYRQWLESQGLATKKR